MIRCKNCDAGIHSVAEMKEHEREAGHSVRKLDEIGVIRADLAAIRQREQELTTLVADMLEFIERAYIAPSKRGAWCRSCGRWITEHDKDCEAAPLIERGRAIASKEQS